jgi:hypothetical protein
MNHPREPKTVTYLVGGVMTGATAIGGAALPVFGYGSAAFLCTWTSTAVGTFAAAGSNDLTTWYPINVAIPLHPSGVAGSAHIVVPTTFEFVKLTYTNASSTGVLGITAVILPGAGSVEVNRVVPPSKVVSGQNTDVDAAAEQLVATATPLMAGITVKALATNTTNIIWVGFSSAVSATTGYPLAGGESVFIEIDDASKVWVFGGAANLAVSYIGS